MLLTRCRQRLARIVAVMQHAVRGDVWVRPAAAHAAGTGTDLPRSRAQLLAENALLRQQVLVPRRSGTRPAVTATDRALVGCSLAESAPGARR